MVPPLWTTIAILVGVIFLAAPYQAEESSSEEKPVWKLDPAALKAASREKAHGGSRRRKKRAPAPGTPAPRAAEEVPRPATAAHSSVKVVSFLTNVFNSSDSDDVRQASILAALDTVTDADIKKLPFAEVEQLVYRSWWKASTQVVIRSHSARMDFTPAVRKATQEVKREADVLLRWLDPSYAHPSPTAMAVRWAQNRSAVMLAARFSPKWDGPGGANLAVFTSEKGRGHIDKERTEELVQKLLRVNISQDRLESEIIAEAGNSRKRFLLEGSFFDEVVPQRSSWSVEFRRAQGSMQMSSGALIPELRIILRKRWPSVRQWPRLTVTTEEHGGLEPHWWAEAPGLSDNDMEALRENPVRSSTPLICGAKNEVYCPTLDDCVSACQKDCPQASATHKESPRCVGPPIVGVVSKALFHDEDLEAGAIAGSFRFQHEVSMQEAADSLSLKWGHSETDALPNVLPIETREAVADAEPCFVLPNGTSPPEGATHLLVLANNEVGEALLAVAPIVDRVYPPSPRGLAFLDIDARRRTIAGFVEVQRSADEAHVEAYEVYFGRSKGDEGLEAFNDPIVASLAGAQERSSALRLELTDVQVPNRATHLIALAIGSGGVRSAIDTAIEIHDASPPTILPQELIVTQDKNGKVGVVTVTTKIRRGSCPESDASKKRAVAEKCDEGTSFVIYWAHANGTRIGPALVEIPLEEAAGGRDNAEGKVREIVDASIPAGATELMVVAKNEHGEMGAGRQQKVSDDKSETLQAWRGTRVLLSGDKSDNAVWRPFSATNDDITYLNADFSPPHDSENVITSLAQDDLGYDVFAGREDGSIACLDLTSDKVWHIAQGKGRITSLAASGQKMQALRGASQGILDVWDLNSGDEGRSLVGHTDEITVIEVDWKGDRAASGSLDGSVRLWNLAADFKDAPQAGTLRGHEAGISALSVSWMRGLALSASYDQTLRLWNLTGLTHAATLVGHSKPVRYVAADWLGMRALSIAEDREVRLWDLNSYECLRTLEVSYESQALALHVNWLSMQAMTVWDDGIARLWDLKDTELYEVDSAALPGSIKVATITPGEEGPLGRVKSSTR